MQILSHQQIIQKSRRMAYEIAEQNLEFEEIILAGINKNGYRFAILLAEEINKINSQVCKIVRLNINPADPISHPVIIEIDPGKDLKNSCVIVVDDVANTGRTVFYGFKSLMDRIVGKVQVAVMVDRTHKKYPVHVNYIGLSLATTLKENIKLYLTDPSNFYALLEN